MSSPTSRSEARVADFPGLYSNRGPFAPAGAAGTAAGQTNLACTPAGGLLARPGLLPVLYDDETPVVLFPPGGLYLIPFFRFRRGA